MLAKLASEAASAPGSFAAPAVRALILYPMNALVNDQLGRLRLLLGDPRVIAQFQAWAGRPRAVRPLHQPDSLPGGPQPEEGPAAARRRSTASTSGCSIEAGDESSPGHDRARRLIDSLQVPRQVARQAGPEGVVRAEERPTGRTGPASSSAPSRCPEDPELLTRHEVLAAPPDVLITNYSMLEYMLMRPLERPVFDMTRAWLEANPQREVPPRRRRGAPVPRRGGRGGRAAAAPAARHGSASQPTGCRSSAPAPASPAPRTPASSPPQLSGKDVEDFRTVRGRARRPVPGGGRKHRRTPKRWRPCRCRSSTTARPNPRRIGAVRGSP